MSVKTYLTNNEKEIKQIAKQLIKQNSLTQLEHLIDTEFSKVADSLEKESKNYSSEFPSTKTSHILVPPGVGKMDAKIFQFLTKTPDPANPISYKTEGKGLKSLIKKMTLKNLAPKTSWLVSRVDETPMIKDATQKEFDDAYIKAEKRFKQAAERHHEINDEIEPRLTNVLKGKYNTFTEYAEATRKIFEQSDQPNRNKKPKQGLPIQTFIHPSEISPEILERKIRDELVSSKISNILTIQREKDLKYRLPAVNKTLEEAKKISEQNVVHNSIYAAIHDYARRNVTIIPQTTDKKQDSVDTPDKYQPPADQQPNAGTTITIDNKNNNENKVTVNAGNTTPTIPPTQDSKKDVQSQRPAKTIDDKVEDKTTGETIIKTYEKENEEYRKETYTDPNPTRINELPKTEKKDDKQTEKTNGKTPPIGSVYTIPEHIREKTKETIDDKIGDKTQKPEVKQETPNSATNVQNNYEPKGGIYDIINAMREALDKAKDKISPEEQDVVKTLYEGLDKAYNMKNKKTELKTESKPENDVKEASNGHDKAGETKNTRRQRGGLIGLIETVIDSAINPNYKPNIRTDYVHERPTLKEALENIYIDFHNKVARSLN